MSPILSIEHLRTAVAGGAAAFRSITKLQPVGGPGDKIFPATYAEGVYATEQRFRDDSSELVDCVLLNSVQSEANHAETALLEALRRGELKIPLIEVDFTAANPNLRKSLPNLTSLEVPHRLADAILRDCMLPDGVRFSQSDYANRWRGANLWNATPLFELCPTALLFGMWGSPEKPGGLGPKFERAFVSEIVAVDVIRAEKRFGFRIDALETSKAVAVRQTATGFEVVKDAKAKGAVPPSKLVHGNIPYDSSNAGLRCRYAEQTTVISLGALRKLRFPVEGKNDPALDIAARTVLAAMGLCAGVLSAERGTSLRSRCHLFPTAPRTWELLATPGKEPETYQLTGAEATALLNEAVAVAQSVGLPWLTKTITLSPTPELIELIRQSQEVAATAGDEK